MVVLCGVDQFPSSRVLTSLFLAASGERQWIALLKYGEKGHMSCGEENNKKKKNRQKKKVTDWFVSQQNMNRNEGDDGQQGE